MPSLEEIEHARDFSENVMFDGMGDAIDIVGGFFS